MKKKLLGILVCMLLIATAFSVNGCVELNDIKSNISIDKGIASSSTTADYKSFFNGHKEGESNILNKDGDWQWAKGAGGAYYDVGAAIVTLSDDSIIVIGNFQGTATFGKGESAETSLVSDGSDDIFLAKYSPVGMIMWAKRAGGTDYDFGNGVSIDGSENIYITGSFEGIANFGPYILTCQSERDNNDIFVAKLSDDGGNFPPFNPSTPSGPTSGETGKSYTYSSSTTDPDGDKVKYAWDWNGDNVVDECDDNSGSYYASGATVSTSHSWSSQGTYNIMVMAEDINGAQSLWSNPLSITMPRSKSNIPFGIIIVFGFDVDVKLIQLEPGENYVDLEVLSKPFYIWENEIQTRNPGEFIRLYNAKGLFLLSLPFCFGICDDWGIIG